MKTLDEIAVEHKTDKGTVYHLEGWPGNRGHGYAPHYEKFFEPMRLLPIRILEVGVGGGESIKTWLEYFPEAKVYGVDMVKDTNPYNTPNSGIERYTYTHGDQSSKEFWDHFQSEVCHSFDIIIDDGGHQSNQVLTTLQCMWQTVVPDGLYCIEDLGVAYGEGTIFVPAGWQNHMDFIKDKLDEINLVGGIKFMYYAKELAIIKKA